MQWLNSKNRGKKGSAHTYIKCNQLSYCRMQNSDLII